MPILFLSWWAFRGQKLFESFFLFWPKARNPPQQTFPGHGCDPCPREFLCALKKGGNCVICKKEPLFRFIFKISPFPPPEQKKNRKYPKRPPLVQVMGAGIFPSFWQFCVSDTHHFRRFPGSEEQSPLSGN